MSTVHSILLPGTYRDSVFLMKLSREAAERSGARRVAAMMGSERNKELLARLGLSTPEMESARPDDLMVAVETSSDLLPGAISAVRELLECPAPCSWSAQVCSSAPHSLEEALDGLPQSNLALISVPGEYARFEAARALSAGLDVMLYSDNISVQDELALKRMAARRGLLLMGPDCGTAIIRHVPLGFANTVRHGNIGIVGSSGTGIQEVSCLLDRCGLGLSSAYGTGGRDLMDAVGGLAALTALSRLKEDAETRIILVIGKTPGPETRAKLLAAYQALGKPVLIRYLGVTDYRPEEAAGVTCAKDLTDLARLAAHKAAPVLDTSEIDLPFPQAAKGRAGLLRGIFSGGTLCREAVEIAMPILAASGRDQDFFSNLQLAGVSHSVGTFPSRGHCFLDMGAQEFTGGRPHPLVSPETKLERIQAELCDPEVRVVLTDIVLGSGVAGNQAAALVQAKGKAAELSGGRSRETLVVASVCGTDHDSPSRSSEVAFLQKSGVIVAGSNAWAAFAAARLAAGLAVEREEETL